MNMPIVKLTNGLTVANFSSPHDFEFEDGSILKACTKKHAEKYKVDFIEKKYDYELDNGIVIKNIFLSFKLSRTLVNAIEKIIEKKQNKFDIIIIPLPMLQAMKQYQDGIIDMIALEDTPFRVIKMVSRTERKVRIDEFCL